MSMTDPVADLLTRIRNATSVKKATVDVPASKLKKSIVAVLVREGYVKGAEELAPTPSRRVLRIQLKYGPDGEAIINRIDRVSTPGCRVYRAVGELPKVRSGLGIAVVSTSLGVFSDREARTRKLGGEVLATLW